MDTTSESTNSSASISLVPAPERSRLGEILVSDGIITPEQLKHALAQQRPLRLPLGKTLLKLNYVTEERMRQALGLQLGVPFIELAPMQLDRSLARVVNRAYARRFALLPVARVGRTLTVAMDDPTARTVVSELTQLTGYSITVVTATSEAIQNAIKAMYDDVPEVRADRTSTGPSAPERQAAIIATSSSVEPGSQRADEIFRQLLSLALEEHCSDIHLEMMPTSLQVRFRVDGMLRQPPFAQFQRSLDQNRREVISRIKILAKLDIAERRRPQDGSFQAVAERANGQVTIDLRVSVIPTYYGESVVIRILDRTRAPKSISELGLSPVVAARLEVLLERTTGILLVTGPTGSGKSTTLAAMLAKLHKPSIRILTAEDPVEYVYDALSQSEVNESIGNTFASYLRSFLRHDPEVIMVGEIRDQETAEMAFRAAQTGHLLLSTLHTNSAIAALPRLLDLNIESSLITSSLIGVLSQRLARRTCDFCREPYVPEEALIDTFFIAMPDDLEFYRGSGCDACGGTGFKGRMMIADLWVPDEQDFLLIARQQSFDEVRTSAERTTFSMAQDAHERLRAGQTTLDELLRVLPHSAVVEHRKRFPGVRGA